MRRSIRFSSDLLPRLRARASCWDLAAADTGRIDTLQ